MSKILAQLVQKPEAYVAKIIDELEAKNGSPSEDVRLLAENSVKSRAKLMDLRLDPNDTTEQELYHALLVRCVVALRLAEVRTVEDEKTPARLHDFARPQEPRLIVRVIRPIGKVPLRIEFSMGGAQPADADRRMRIIRAFEHHFLSVRREHAQHHRGDPVRC